MAETTLGVSGDLSLDGWTLNADVDWDSFHPEPYIDDNYRTVRHDDGKIIEHCTGFFERSVGQTLLSPNATAVDVGSGANLYPALMMLPFVANVHLFERGAANVAWLNGQQGGFDDNWLRFWDRMSPIGHYAQVSHPKRDFAAKAEVIQGDLFDLPPAKYDIGTMFFVAESMSTDEAEFKAALERFIRSLRPSAPFAAAFMEKSHGYKVDGVLFPACPVDEDIVRLAFDRIALDLDIVRVPYGADDGALRDGHDAMIVATGRAK
ncbi:SCO2525 family SAM-dependent methyltransferase [Cryptosporangium minutisporangium]|uniref:SCO2525 family SAM-dependent methyltransferase n=1 Tax=Cryptosporangium minutisporangium TaxID=113569 RepID=UPI0031E88F8A